MKLVKSLAIGALALASISSSFATTVKVTGSTAYRKALYAGIIQQLGGATAVKAAYIGSSLAGANQAIFTNGTDTVISCMAGSVGGIDWVSNGGNVATVAPFNGATYVAKTATAWLDASNLTAAAFGNVTLDGTNAISGGGLALTSPVYSAASTADFTMSDSLQSSTPADDQVNTLTQATGEAVGVVEFMFAKGDSANVDATSSYARFTNMTSLGFQNLVANGTVPMAAFTGDPADKTTLVALVGRDNDSGTRLAAAFETGLNDVNFAMNQFLAQDSSGNDVGIAGSGTIAKLVPAADVLSGYSSGGQVKACLNAPVSSSATIKIGKNFVAKKFVLVGYVGTGDKPTVAPTGGVAASEKFLSYNGVAWDSTGLKTQLGQYTFWTYEQAYYLPTLDSAKQILVDAIVTAIKPLAPAANGVTISSMQASRLSEGAVVNNLY